MTSASAPAPPARRTRGRAFRIARAAVIAVVVLLALPYVLTPLYLVFDPIPSAVVWRWLRGGTVERTVVPMDRIAPVLPRTVIASEDAKFCRHRGIDWGELKAAIDEADDLSEARGASTITQQTAKNVFLWGGRSFVRKALEFPLALWMDLILPKRRIMELYLNAAEWGPSGEFGVEAGARRAFNKSARDLNASEAALLTAVLPNPHRRSARQPGPAVRRIATRAQARAAGAGDLDACLQTR